MNKKHISKKTSRPPVGFAEIVFAGIIGAFISQWIGITIGKGVFEVFLADIILMIFLAIIYGVYRLVIWLPK
jgi:apolipoprotein N-acyltransferase